ncbi:M15 family metallopeptidase [Candidatus Gracilibacteria bacterium]|nr:M15 family metallopeptidase [Candidatus Gracilibacteria bacterium]
MSDISGESVGESGSVLHSGTLAASGLIYDIYDFERDDSYTKFVSHEITYNKIDYTPSDLTGMIDSPSLISEKSILLRTEALENLVLLSEDFFAEFSEPLKIVSGYRSYEYQQSIESRSPECIRDGYCARAGHSEHQSGLAVDFFETTNEEEFLKNEKYKQYFIWLQNNAHIYGFINSYTQGREIDGYHIEPWHWRYVGVEFAQYLNLSGISFSEYYQKVTTN